MKVTANDIIAYMETLEISEGSLRGQNFKVLDWQREFIDGFIDKSISALTIARGNGKTTFIAALACAALDPDGPLHIERGQIVIVAASLKQAGIAFEHIRYFMNIQQVGYKTWRIQDNTHNKQIRYVPDGTHLHCIGSDPKKAHGLAPTLAICDEPAKWEKNQSGLMYSALRTARGKQEYDKLVALGTLPDSRENWFFQLIKEGNEKHNIKAYYADRSDDPFQVETIRKANPSYEHLKELQSAIADEMSDAEKNGGGDMTMYQALRLNMGTPEVHGREVIVSLENWKAVVKREPAPRDGPCFVGFDLGGGVSMSGIAFYWPTTGRLEAYGGFPAEPGLEARGRDDKVADRYVRMYEREELYIYPGLTMNNPAFLEEMLRKVDRQSIENITGDAYKSLELKQALVQVGLEHVAVFRRVGRGAEGSADIRGFQAEVLTAHLNTSENVALESAIAESCVHRDTNGNPALNKARQEGRIDILQAAVLAVGQGRRWRLPENGHQFDPSDYVLVDEEAA